MKVNTLNQVWRYSFFSLLSLVYWQLYVLIHNCLEMISLRKPSFLPYSRVCICVDKCNSQKEVDV